MTLSKRVIIIVHKKTRKEIVYNTLLDLLNSVDSDSHSNGGIDTEQIALKCNLDRANVSKELNILYREGLITKTNSRPVLYMPVSKSKQEYINNCSKTVESNQNDWSNFIGSSGSLSSQVTQGKAAVKYPGGLDLLITGTSGTGKTLFAKLLYKYAVRNSVVSPEAPFIVFNCADYANNPQLLLSQLFGYVKGTFTGAEKDKSGLVDAAEKGFLFLDEMHRLPPEGQEMLYLLLDQRVYHRLGDPGNLRSVEIRLMFATTENPDAVFLSPFIRRIPVVINLPPLSERPVKEKQDMINTFFQDEAKKIKYDLIIQGKVLDCLLRYNGPGNVGELRSIIKLTCANALHNKNEYDLVCSKSINQGSLMIGLNTLPSKIMQSVSAMSWWNNELLIISAKITKDTVTYEYASDMINNVGFKSIPPKKICSSNINTVKVIVIAHGPSTASSLSIYVNELLGIENVYGFDIEVRTNPDELVTRLIEFFKSFTFNKDLIVFADLPDLSKLIYSICELFNINVNIINSISTPAVLEAARLSIQEGITSGHILYSITNNPSFAYAHYSSQYNHPCVANKVILTTCITGTGTAERIKRLLTDIFPSLLAAGCDIISLKAEQIRGTMIFDIDEELRSIASRVVIVIGTIDPKIQDIDFIPVEDFLTELGLNKVANLLKDNFGINQTEDMSKVMIKALSVEALLEYLTVLNPKITANTVFEYLDEVESALGNKVSHKTKLRLLIHTACMLERIITANESLEYPQQFWQASTEQMELALKVLRSNTFILEKVFPIVIPDDELALIAEIMLFEKE